MLILQRTFAKIRFGLQTGPADGPTGWVGRLAVWARGSGWQAGWLWLGWLAGLAGWQRIFSLRAESKNYLYTARQLMTHTQL